MHPSHKRVVHGSWGGVLLHETSKGEVLGDKVWMYKGMMMNGDNLESNLLTLSSLKIHSLYKFCRVQVTHVEPDVYVEVRGDWRVTTIYNISVYHSLHGSMMGYSLRVTRAGVADHECEC